MTADEFRAATGYDPEGDDLERANCEQAGMIGHTSCGVCEHGKPVFLCETCFFKPIPIRMPH